MPEAKVFFGNLLQGRGGTCVASCPSGTIVQNLSDYSEIISEINGLLQPLEI